LVEQVREKNEENPVIVYSKSWCPYCSQVKQLFQKLEVPAKIVELDSVVEGDDVQAALYDISSSRTVPQVFIGGEFVGGADDTIREYSSGALSKRLSKVGITEKEL
jgi:glutaredoxin 3